MKLLTHLLIIAGLAALGFSAASDFIGTHINAETAILVLTTSFVALISIQDYARRARRFEITPRHPKYRVAAFSPRQRLAVAALVEKHRVASIR